MSDSADFFATLLRYEIALWDALDDALMASHGVAFGRFQTMQAISARGGHARVHDLAEDLAITVGATSKLVDRLEQDGIARRQPNPDDRRSSLISLTTEGERLHAAAAATFEEALRESLPAETDLTILTAALRGLLNHLRRPVAAGAAR